MTSKHFIALADALRNSQPKGTSADYRQWETDVKAVATVCEASNDRFDRVKFIAACGGFR